MTRLPSGLYGMADATFGDPVVQTRRLVGAGCRVVQLRCKHWPTGDRLRAAQASLRATRAGGALLIINDDFRCAAKVGADGVHLGQGDGAIGPAREALPPGALVGRSTHDRHEIQSAIEEGADYIGFGPMFATSTKQTGFAPRGTARLARAVTMFPGPVVAIGGINEETLAGVLEAGPHGWAVGSGIWQSSDPEHALRVLVATASDTAG